MQGQLNIPGSVPDQGPGQSGEWLPLIHSVDMFGMELILKNKVICVFS